MMSRKERAADYPPEPKLMDPEEYEPENRIKRLEEEIRQQKR